MSGTSSCVTLVAGCILVYGRTKLLYIPTLYLYVYICLCATSCKRARVRYILYVCYYIRTLSSCRRNIERILYCIYIKKIARSTPAPPAFGLDTHGTRYTHVLCVFLARFTDWNIGTRHQKLLLSVPTIIIPVSRKNVTNCKIIAIA